MPPKPPCALGHTSRVSYCFYCTEVDWSRWTRSDAIRETHKKRGCDETCTSCTKCYLEGNGEKCALTCEHNVDHADRIGWELDDLDRKPAEDRDERS